MADFVERFREVQDADICLEFVLHIASDVVGELEKLGFT